MKTAKCPVCKTKSIEGHMMFYETSIDHVCDPNGYRTRYPAQTLVCPNPFCQLFQKGFWSYHEGLWYNYQNEEIIWNVPAIYTFTEIRKPILILSKIYADIRCLLFIHCYTTKVVSHNDEILGWNSICRNCGKQKYISCDIGD